MQKKKRFIRMELLTRFRVINILLLFIVASLFINAYISMKMIDEGKILFGGEISYMVFQINFATAVLVLIAALAFILHYGFGALSRMEKILGRILEGNYSLRIKLRKKDIMRPFAEKLNKVLDLLERNQDR